MTTVRYAKADVAAAFCRWHLFKGFAHVFMFFEDPQEAFAFKQYMRQHLSASAQAAEEDLNHSYDSHDSLARSLAPRVPCSRRSSYGVVVVV